MVAVQRKIVLGVTVDQSLMLLSGFPGYLVSRGWDVHVVSSPGSRLDRLAELPGITAHALPMTRNPSPARDLRALVAWTRLLRRVRPDVTYVGTPKAGLLGGVAGWVTRVPHRVYLLRGLRLESSSGAARIILLTLERLAAASATNVVAISRSLRLRAVMLGVVSPDKVRVLGSGSSNGTDIEQFDARRFTPSEVRALRTELGLEVDMPVVGFVGRLTRDKGVFVLADALRSLVEVGVRVQVLLVGGVEDESGEAGLRSLRSLGVPLGVTGHVDDPARYYAAMSVLCLPSYREGFGNVVIEASSSGLPVAVSNATGVVDAVRDGETGLVSPVGDADALAVNLHKLLTDAALATSMGQSGRAWVAEHFERRHVQKHHADALEAMMGLPRPTSRKTHGTTHD